MLVSRDASQPGEVGLALMSVSGATEGCHIL